jgi:ubiquinone/menaquinone biosynthesis C-methylase UbiE
VTASGPVKRGATQIRDHYRQPPVVEHYHAQRFREPLGALLHARQAAGVRALVRRVRPLHVAELAAGAGRLAHAVGAELTHPGLLIDTSLPMLMRSRSRLGAAGQAAWRSVQADVFHLPVATGALDLVYCFRFIRHLETPERDLCYQEIRRVLRRGGWFVFDAVNEAVSAPLRATAPPGEYTIYDALFRPDGLRAELAAAGFTSVALHGIQFHYALLRRLQVLLAPRSRRLARLCMEVVERIGGGEPLEWVVTCRRG